MRRRRMSEEDAPGRSMLPLTTVFRRLGIDSLQLHRHDRPGTFF